VQIHLGLTAALVQLLSASVSPRDLGCPKAKKKNSDQLEELSINSLELSKTQF
jgi:hypothetical protein